MTLWPLLWTVIVVTTTTTTRAFVGFSSEGALMRRSWSNSKHSANFSKNTIKPVAATGGRLSSSSSSSSKLQSLPKSHFDEFMSGCPFLFNAVFWTLVSRCKIVDDTGSVVVAAPEMAEAAGVSLSQAQNDLLSLVYITQGHIAAAAPDVEDDDGLMYFFPPVRLLLWLALWKEFVQYYASSLGKALKPLTNPLGLPVRVLTGRELDANEFVEDLLMAQAALTIHANQGIVTSEQLAQYCYENIPHVDPRHDPHVDQEDERLVLPIVTALNGKPLATKGGDIVYIFPEFLPSAKQNAPPLPTTVTRFCREVAFKHYRRRNYEQEWVVKRLLFFVSHSSQSFEWSSSWMMDQGKNKKQNNESLMASTTVAEEQAQSFKNSNWIISTVLILWILVHEVGGQLFTPYYLPALRPFLFYLFIVAPASIYFIVPTGGADEMFGLWDASERDMMENRNVARRNWRVVLERALADSGDLSLFKRQLKEHEQEFPTLLRKFKSCQVLKRALLHKLIRDEEQQQALEHTHTLFQLRDKRELDVFDTKMRKRMGDGGDEMVDNTH